ncbi:TPA: hypothetical protein ACGORC_000874 [Streptococcus suis]
MQVKFDFILNRQYSSVEKTIFRLVLNGMTNALEIRKLLWILSDEVIAEAVRKLVNRQILKVDLSAGIIRLSDPIDAIIQKCLSEVYELEISEVLAPDDNTVIHIQRKSTQQLNIAILEALLPNVNLEFLNNSIDFYISKVGDNSGR